MELKFSKEEYDGYTHRFKVQFEVEGNPHYTNIDLYTNTDSYEKVEEFVNEKKSNKVMNFKVVHRASKEQDDMASKFIEETLKDI